MMERVLAPRSSAVSRRGFLRLAGTAAGVVLWRGGAAAGDDAHRVLLRVPTQTSNGARVPITADVAHPMEPEHHVTTLTIVNPRDPVPLKGVFEFTPANGRAYVAFQARLDEGPSTLVAAAECARHGRFGAGAAVTIAPGAGGCAGGPPPAGGGGDEIRPPVLRIPRLVADGRIGAGEIVDVQVKTKHPNRTGLVLRAGTFVRDTEPFHLSTMDVFQDGTRVSHFVLSAALSDNPLITFKLRVHRDATIGVTLTNTRGQRFETAQQIRLD